MFEYKQTNEDFLQYLNKKTKLFILKGGTALMECYNLTRYTDEICLDGPKGKNGEIDKIIESYAIERGILLIIL